MDSLLRPWRSVHDGNPRFESSGARHVMFCGYVDQRISRRLFLIGFGDRRVVLGLDEWFSFAFTELPVAMDVLARQYGPSPRATALRGGGQ